MRDDEDQIISKSQRKRDMLEITRTGEQLLALSDEQLSVLPYPDILAAITACRKITKGNARKRQIQYIGKLLRNVDLDPVTRLLERFDASTRTHVAQFHQLETWRERLMADDASVVDEIMTRYPETDRQQLMQLTRKAISEQQQEGAPPVQFRKLFQFLKSLENSA